MQLWIKIGFEAPARFLANDDGEFSNVEFKNMFENLKSGFSIQQLKAHGKIKQFVVDRCLEKIVEQNSKLNLQVALAWIINTKNCLQV